MKKKIIGIFVCTLLIATGFASAKAVKNEKSEDDSESMNIDRNTLYFITAKDHLDVLDDSSIDNIAIITLYGDDNIDLSEITIFISPDKKSWVETKILEQGLWHIGEQITISELHPDDVSSNIYIVRVLDTKINKLYAEKTVKIDNPSKTLSGFYNQFQSSSVPTTLDMPESASSNAYIPEEFWEAIVFTPSLLPEEHDCGISAGVKYYGRDWEENLNMWEYEFRLDGIHAGFFYIDIYGYAGTIDVMNLYVEESESVNSVTFPDVGSWCLDENGPDNYDIAAIIVCDIALGALPYGLGIPFTIGADLADALAESPDISWENPTYVFVDNSGFCFIFVYVPPETDWSIKLNLEVVYPYLSGIPLDLADGEGKIVYGEKSPPKPSPPSKPTISGPKRVKEGSSNTYKFTSTDPDGDDVSYYIKWGDGDTTGWTSYQSSGTSCSRSHIWSSVGTYTIQAKAKDTWGAESDWALYTVFVEPKSRSHSSVFLRLLQNHPNLFTILNQLVRLGIFKI